MKNLKRGKKKSINLDTFIMYFSWVTHPTGVCRVGISLMVKEAKDHTLTKDHCDHCMQA